MTSFSFLNLWFFSLVHAAAGLQPSDHLMMFALLGDGVTLPCNIPSVESCSSVNWSVAGQFRTVTEVVKAGRVTVPNVLRLGLLKDCSLEIHHLVLDDARLYSCSTLDSGALNSSVSLQTLELTESLTPADGIIELHCFLNTFTGHVPCKNKGIRIKWSTEDDTPLNGTRFRFENPTDCFSKLFISTRLTDHHRKWKCQLFHNDIAKVTISYTTKVKDGIEEVFAAVGESVSLSCSNTSSLGMSGSKQWAIDGGTLRDNVSPNKGQTDAFHVNKGSSLIIRKVSPQHAGDYQCLESTGQKKVLYKIRLHILDVTSEGGPGGDNLTMTCVLTCPEKCGQDINLTWSGRSQDSWQSNLMTDNNTLIKRLFLPAVSMTSDDLTCSVHREGYLMVSKKWHSVNTLHTSTWLALLLGLLICIAAGALYIHMKRKRIKDVENEESGVGMTNIYEAIQDSDNEEPTQQRQPKQETVATIDSFYDLLQAVN